MPNFALDPASFATLQSTLGPAGALSILQAQQLEQQKQLQQATTQATQQAQQAGQAYQQAAAAPVQEPSALDQFLPRLLGGIASVVARDPQFAQRADQDINQQRRGLLQNRLDNLAALKESWDKKAAIAEHANDLEQTISSRQKSEQISKLMDQLNETAAQKSRLEQIQETGRQQRLTEQERGKQDRLTQQEKNKGVISGGAEGASGADYIQLYNRPDGTQVPYVDLSQIKGQKLHDALKAYALQNKLPATDARGREALDLIGSVRGDISSITQDIIPLLPSGGGFKRMREGAANIAQKTLQTSGKGATLAAYPATRTAAIKTIQALASLGKGLRINQAEIKAAQEFDFPRDTDTQEVANKKFKILGMMLGHIEDAILGNPPSNAEVQKVLNAARALRAGRPATVDESDVEDVESYRRAQ